MKQELLGMYDSILNIVFFNQKTAYEMRISDWSSDVCSSDLHRHDAGGRKRDPPLGDRQPLAVHHDPERPGDVVVIVERLAHAHHDDVGELPVAFVPSPVAEPVAGVHHLAQDFRRLQRSEEHTSELQSLMRISYAVFCLKKKIRETTTHI